MHIGNSVEVRPIANSEDKAINSFAVSVRAAIYAILDHCRCGCCIKKLTRDPPPFRHMYAFSHCVGVNVRPRRDASARFRTRDKTLRQSIS